MNKKDKQNRSLNPELRKKIIFDLLNKQYFVSTQEVINKCNVSEITIRRDFSDLEAKGLLIRTHGGVIKSRAANQLFTYDHKISQNRQNKEDICRKASEFIENNDIIFIDCGSTLTFLTKYITKFESLTVITNSLPIVSDLINFTNIKLILIGGEVVNDRKAIYGLFADKNIAQYHADKAFIGADGISLAKGLTSYDEKEASITQKMAENADEVFLLCDSSKIEKNSFVRFASLPILDHVVTDRNLEVKYIEKYKEHNINIILTKK